MLIIMITHADARFVKPDYIYRSLTGIGREQVRVAAADFRKLLPTIVPTLDGKTKAIAKIISSPMARCLETVMLFADELRDLTKTSEICINDKLKQKDPPKQHLTIEDLVAVLKGTGEDVILIGVHGHLAGALPSSTRLIDGACDTRDKAFFDPRPVVAAIDYDPDEPWESAKVLYCQGHPRSAWKDLLAQ